MRVTSRKRGSKRDRIDIACDCSSVATWRVEWVPDGSGMARVGGRSVMLTSMWGGERSYEIFLTEDEARAVAKAVVDDFFVSPLGVNK